MVIPPALYYLFAPFIMGIIGVIADKIKVPKLRDGVAILISIWGMVSVWMLYNMGVASGDILVFSIGGFPPLGACFEIDLMSIYFAGSAALLSFLVTVYSYSYMEHDTRLTEYYALLCAITVGMMGVTFAGDMFTMFLFWEMMGIASYSLVSFRKDKPGPVEAGFKYMVMGSVGSVVLFFGMALIYGMTGSMNFAVLATTFRSGVLTPWSIMVFSMLVVGFGVKSAIVPMHTWLPDAHPEAPSPISALLSGIVIETGLYALIRVLFVLYEPSLFKVPIAILAVATMTVGNIMALRQDDLKRMLAYSSVAQIGYMLIGVSTGMAYGLLGTFLHIFNHSFMKGVAFLGVGSIDHMTGTRDINKLKGVGRKMPLTTFAIVVAFLGLAGFPGTSGFISKFVLFSSSMGAGLSLVAVFGVLNSTISVAYYARAIMALLGETGEDSVEAKEPPMLMVGVTIAMALVILVFGIAPDMMTSLADAASRALIEGLGDYIGAIL
jgi:multicomponent Na+:H+ antiporter subunit D